MEDKTSVLFVTANVGSIFEDPDAMINLWIQEFLQTVTRYNAKFIALHCQEVGGKNYETCMQHVDNFVKHFAPLEEKALQRCQNNLTVLQLRKIIFKTRFWQLCKASKLLISSHEFNLFDKAEIFLDEDFSCAENFTALGNFYFIHESITDVMIWNFEDLKFEYVDGKNVHEGNIEKIPIKEKSKFPQNFFPECKWSRKGYIRTRWSLNGSIFDLVNIHLFHDASNFVAIQAYPSVYTVTRQKALQYCLNRFYSYEEGPAPFFLFGDFNFRTDTGGVIKKLTTGLNEYKETDSCNEDTKLEYKDESSEVVITIGKKRFSHNDHQNIFINDSGEWLKEYDREMEVFKDQLFEFPIRFLPSYPFEENASSGRSYMRTRCPAWCDRVLLSANAKQLISKFDIDETVEYGVIGTESCMGDHKPVFLFFNLINGAGIIQTKLLCRRVCAACKLSSSIFHDAYNDLPLIFKSHFSNNLRCDPTCISTATNCSNKKHHRYVSRCYDSNITLMSTVTELSDCVSDNDSDTYYLANTTPMLSGSNDVDHSDRSCNDDKSVSNDVDESSDKSNYNSIDSATDSFIKTLPSEIVDKSIELKFDHTEDDLPFSRFYKCCKSKEFASRSFDENVGVRSSSALTVVESSWRSKTCTCLPDTGWRMRSVSSSSHTSGWNSDNRVRLKSDPNLKHSLPRIQSHHSSSDEEWFEEVNETSASDDDERANVEKVDSGSVEDIKEYIAFDALPSDGIVACEPVCALVTEKPVIEKEVYCSRKNKYFLFCIPRKRKEKHRTKKFSTCKLPKVRYFRFLSSRSGCKFCCSS